MFKSRLFTPGPTPLLPQVQQALSLPILHHRTKEFRHILTEVLDGLCYLYDTKNDVLLYTASATGVMEGAVVNLLNPEDEAIVVSVGKFGERWVDLCRTHGIMTHVLAAPYGQIIDPQDVAVQLEKYPSTRAVFVQYSESSTGVKLNIKTLGEIVCQFPQTVLVVDAVTGLGVMELPVDGWHLDVVIAGSQKALMIPPGLAFASISEKAWRLIGNNRCPSFYFDFRKEREQQLRGETSYTPSTSLILALREALKFIRELSREVLIENAGLLAEATRVAAKSLGLHLFAEAAPSDALTVVCAPSGIDSSTIIKKLKNDFGYILANGQGEMRGKVFRIAHLGYNDFCDTLALIACLELVLRRLGVSVNLGSGVRAAQGVYLRRKGVDG